MVIIGLTGSIGMGKSTIAQMFADEGVPVWSADEAVHRLYQQDQQLISQLVQAFGDISNDHGIDRARLSKSLADDPSKFQLLNSMVHPAVAKDRQAFIARHQSKKAQLVVFDIPLLLETQGQKQVDVVIVVTAPEAIQRQRVLQRAGMTEAKLKLILTRQMPDAQKRDLADYLIDTSNSLDECRQYVRDIIIDIVQKHFTNHP